MTFWNYSIGEWATLLGIISVLISVVVWVIKVTILNTFYDKLDDQNTAVKYSTDRLTEHLQSLSEAIEALTTSAKTEHQVFEKRLDEHDRRLDRHHKDIKNLYTLNEKDTANKAFHIVHTNPKEETKDE